MSNTTANTVNITYTLSFPQAQTHYAEIEMELSGLSGPYIELKMPVWTPGSYLVREYAKNLESLSAEGNGQLLAVQKINKNTWRVELSGVTSFKVKYSLYCFEISVRNNFVNTAHAFITGASTFLYPAGQLHSPATIHIKPYPGWHKVSTGLNKAGADPFTLHSPDYDTLFDSPIEVGTQDVFTFEATGVAYEVAMCLGGNYDTECIKNNLATIAQLQTEIFGENPNQRYVYIIHNYAKAGGGLEHSNSTVLGVTRDSYSSEDGYQKFLALASHEHFHLWNAKRLRPIALGPFDYEAENYTPSLWIAEGFTNYYDNLIVHRMGLYPTDNYLALLCADINTVENTPGSRVQPVTEASFDAWIKYYRQNENSNNSGISYYTKGGLIAMMLDLEIIHHTKGQQSLDSMMKAVYSEFYKVRGRGFTEDEFKRMLENFTGGNLDVFYQKYVNGVAALDYGTYLGYAGFKLIDDNAGITKPSLGITTVVRDGRTIITSVMRGGSAWVGGLNVNDEILAIESLQVSDAANMLVGKAVGDTLAVAVIRDGLTLNILVTLQKNNQVSYRIADAGQLSPQQLVVRGKWLQQKLT